MTVSHQHEWVIRWRSLLTNSKLVIRLRWQNTPPHSLKLAKSINALFCRWVSIFPIRDWKKSARNIIWKNIYKFWRFSHVCPIVMEFANWSYSLIGAQKFGPCRKTRSDHSTGEAKERLTLALLKLSWEYGLLKDTSKKLRTAPESGNRLVQAISFQQARSHGVYIKILIGVSTTLIWNPTGSSRNAVNK